MTGAHWVFPRTGLEALEKQKRQINGLYQNLKHDFSDVQQIAYAPGRLLRAPNNKLYVR